MATYSKKFVSILILIAFISTSIKTPSYAQVDPMPFMPKPGVMVQLSPEYTPAYLKGIVIHPENAFKFDFIINRGDQPLTEEQKKVEYTKLTKYFLASLAIPDEDQWVNLSPYEKDRIIKDDFGQTEMGRDLLAQDYMLKQITASLIYPENSLGKKFWDKIYAQAQKQFGTTDIPVNTFNKVWILPDNAVIYEKGNTAYVLKNHLRVMLEEDYLSLAKHTGIESNAIVLRDSSANNREWSDLPTLTVVRRLIRRSPQNDAHTIASKIVREIVLPELEREVNLDKNFAPLRQVYSGMLLAAWYKRALKESLLNRFYTNKNKIKGVDYSSGTMSPMNKKELSSPNVLIGDPEYIYRQYLKAYKKGVFNFIKDDLDQYAHESIPRKYFSGGAVGFNAAIYTHVVHATTDSAQIGRENTSNLDFASVATKAFKIESADAAMVNNKFTKILYLMAAIGLLIIMSPDLLSQIQHKLNTHISIGHAQEWPIRGAGLIVLVASLLTVLSYGSIVKISDRIKSNKVNRFKETMDSLMENEKIIQAQAYLDSVGMGLFNRGLISLEVMNYYQIRLDRLMRPDADPAMKVLPLFISKNNNSPSGSADAAMKGGIDFNAAHLNFLIKREGKRIPLPFDKQDMAQLNLIQGLEPVILSIKPATSVLLFAELLKSN